MKTNQYVGICTHDNGVFTLRTAATSADAAHSIIVTSENCPTRAVEILKIEKIEDVKKGEYFKLKPTAKEVWVKQDYNRYAKRYTAYSFNDINKWKHLKKGKEVVTDFEF